MDALVSTCRSYRRFSAGAPVETATLKELVSLARRAPSAANRQPLKYVLSGSAEMNARIFPTLAWAAYFKDWPGPETNERPAAYIVVLLDTTITQSADVDVGIAAQTILLAATERGLGGCMLGGIKRDQLGEVLRLPPHLTISLVIALGKPVERVVLEDLPADGSIKYYRGPDGTHHVPKRALADLIHAVYG
ncbi:MAG TPA: nitroreductase family protein [Spirochaetia bacterium]|nr:nitroreductase family protein [Spirochaetia bacterium]